jgi:hypothetical protein
MVQSLPPQPSASPIAGSSLPPPGVYFGPTVDGVPVRQGSRAVVALLAAVGSALGLLAWLFRVFANSGQQRKLWTGVWRVDLPLVVVALALAAAFILSVASQPAGPGLAAGILVAVLPTLTGSAPTRSYSATRAIGALAILATCVAIAAALRAARNEPSVGNKAVLPASLAVALLVVGQAASVKFGFAGFDAACFIGVAVGLALANRVGWWTASGALLFHVTRIVTLSGLATGSRFGSPFRLVEMLCGLALLVVCVVLALMPKSARQLE